MRDCSRLSTRCVVIFLRKEVPTMPTKKPAKKKVAAKKPAKKKVVKKAAKKPAKKKK